MRKLTHLAAALALLLLIAGAAQADNTGRIYGKIHTVDGDTFEGLIRWDKNEGSWVDLLNGTRDRDDRDRDRKYESARRKYKSGRSRVRIFGIDISDDNNYLYISGSSSSSGVRFGHLKSLKVLDDDRALLTLKSDREVEFYNGSTDIGEGIREIVIEDPDEGEVEFTWDDIELIEFSDTDFKGESAFGERLYGKLTTRRGDEFTGFGCGDVDELFDDLGLGQVQVDWDDFDKLEFSKAPSAVQYSKFDGGKKMTGTVYTEDGKEYTGEICWDDDEEYTWEILNGNVRDMEYSIEFGLIKEISKDSRRASEVTLKDGRTFQLRGSNDVDDDNKGLIITESKGQEVFVDWEDFSRVVFSH